MNLKRLFNLAAALAAVAAATVVCVVAAAFAIYALARIWLGPAGGAAVTAAVFAALAAAVAAFVVRRVPPADTAEDVPLVERLVQMAKERPLVAAGAAAAILTIVVRNPSIISAILSAVIAGNTARPDEK